MELELQAPHSHPFEPEPSMNIISAGYDLIMVNRPNDLEVEPGTPVPSRWLSHVGAAYEVLAVTERQPGR
jgi:hypothetical protein